MLRLALLITLIDYEGFKMSFVNNCELMGNLGADPKLYHHSNGTVSCTVSLATHDQSVTTWHKLFFWGRLAEVLTRYARKGDKIYVTGALRHHSYKDSNGNQRHKTEIVVKQVKFINTKGFKHDEEVEQVSYEAEEAMM